LSNISIVAISVGLPVGVNNPSRISTIPCNLTRFCVEGSNKHNDRGHFSNDLELLTDRTFRASFRIGRMCVFYTGLQKLWYLCFS